MPSKNQIIVDAFQSIREFLDAQQTQLYELQERINILKQEQKRFDVLEQSQEQQKTQLKVLEERTDKVDVLKQTQAQQKTLLEILEDRTDKLEKLPVNEVVSQLDHLKQALVHLDELESRLDDTDLRTKELANILPHAIRQASQTLDEPTTYNVARLTDSLQQPVEQCIKHSINQDAHSFADALFPVMGPAIRKAIQESFKNLIQTINKTAEQSLSPQGIAWRLEARRKGLPFSELVLQKTIVFRVEQVFLIHRESGLLIQHRHREGVEIGDSDAISAMFTAIQDFIRDSFSSNKTEELDSVEIGEYTVWLERGPYAVLACVIRGIAPYELREIMRSSLENMHARYGVLLQQFAGDNEPLTPCQPLLDKTLQSESKKDAQTQQRLLSPQLIGILGVILLALLGWGYWYFQFQQRLTNYMDALQDTPGIVVISTKHQDGKLLIYGMRDPLASEPQAQRFKLSKEEVESFWTPYQDLTPHFIEQRVRLRLATPSTVLVRVQDNVLHLSGHASQNWIDKANTILATGFVPGIDQVVIDELQDTDQFLLALAKQELAPPDHINLKVQKRTLQIIGSVDSATFDALQQRIQNLPISAETFIKLDTSGIKDVERERNHIIQDIEKTKFYFPEGSAEFQQKQKTALQTLHKNMQQLLALSQTLHQPIHLHITGSTDGRGTKIYNQKLGQQRAEVVQDWLHNEGIEKEILVIAPPPIIRFGESEASPDDRNVSFQIKIQAKENI